MFPKYLNEIEDIDMRKAVEGCLINNKITGRKVRILVNRLKYEKIENLTWKNFCLLIENELNIHNDMNCSDALRKLFGYIVESDLYVGQELPYLKKFSTWLQKTKRIKTDKLKYFFDKDRSLESTLFYSYQNRYKLITLKSSNTFIINLISEYLKIRVPGNFNEKFYEDFFRSCEEINNYTSISNFNYTTFLKQFNYFNNNYNKSCKNRDDNFCLRDLISFYNYILSLPEGNNILKISDPIDKNMLVRGDFISLFINNFRLVHYNPNECYPQHNKWVLTPNGFEYKSTRMHANKYYLIDFTKIKNSLYRDICKDFFWSQTTTIPVRINKLRQLIYSLNYIEKYKESFINNLSKKIIYENIISTDIYSYKIHILNTFNVGTTASAYLLTLKEFLIFSKEKNLLNVHNACFEYLESQPRKKGEGGLDIPDNDLKKLENQLRNVAYDNDENFLYYVIFHIAIDTEFRISQILSLKINEIEEGMKTNQYFIKSITKVSNGNIIPQAISSYTKRHIDEAIKYTSNLRKECSDSNIKSNIFLRRSNRNTISIITIDSFNRFIKSQCEAIGIYSYTAANLRDTHMTKSKEYILKKELSSLEEKVLTGHKTPEVTNENYYNPKIRTYLESTFGIIIGDVDIKGNIIRESESNFTKADTVADECGFCNKISCDMLNFLDCLMCNGFVVTLDRIPFYEKKLAILDKFIDNEQIEHEREHLVTIKRLFVAYLEKLYILKETSI